MPKAKDILYIAAFEVGYEMAALRLYNTVKDFHLALPLVVPHYCVIKVMHTSADTFGKVYQIL